MLTTSSKLALCEKVNYHKLTVGEVNESVKIDIPKITQLYRKRTPLYLTYLDYYSS